MGNSELRRSLLKECGEVIAIFSRSLQTHRAEDKKQVS